jgi:hypothetical protein
MMNAVPELPAPPDAWRQKAHASLMKAFAPSRAYCAWCRRRSTCSSPG